MYVYRCPRCPAKVSLVESIRSGVVCESCHYTMAMLPSDAAPMVLPLDQVPAHLVTPGMVPLHVKHLHAAGYLLPETQDALEWLYRHRERNGMAGAFLKVGGRRCIDLVAFAKLIREQKA